MPVITCACGCGRQKSLPPSTASRQKYVSRECISRERKESKTCPQCQKIFEGYKNQNRKYCTRKCSGKANAAKRRNGLSRKCPECGKAFITKKAYVDKGEGIYCSVKCGRKGAGKKVAKHYNAARVLVVCKYCGKEKRVKPSKGDTMYCGKECANLAITKTTPEQKKLRGTISRRVGYLLKKRGSDKCRMKTEELLGYSIGTLQRHLEKTIPDGYCWEDYLSNKLQVDHIDADAHFNYKSPYDIDFRRSWDIKNLRLLETRKNQVKGARLERPMQPSFSFTALSFKTDVIVETLQKLVALCNATDQLLNDTSRLEAIIAKG